MSKVKTKVYLSEETEDTIKDIVKLVQANADTAQAVQKQTLYGTMLIGFLMVCATAAPLFID